MTLDQAREWANRNDRIQGVFHPDAQAAVEVIQSLPDQWVDVEEVREIIEEMKNLPATTGVASEIAIATEAWKRRLEALVPPTLPTLYELVIEQKKNPEEYRWMQAKAFHTGEQGCVTDFDLYREIATVIFPNGVMKNVPWEEVTPLPGEPKLKWPGSAPDDVAYATGGVLTTQDVVDECRDVRKERALLRPEGVPADELWLVELREEEWVGRRSRKSRDYPWYIASPNGEGAEIAQDSEITLIHKLVPETHALPEGMRLADHEALGRIIVSPKEDSDGEHLSFFPDESTRCGANWTYLQKSEFTYLDGETK